MMRRGHEGMRGGISGRVANGDMSPYSSQSPNTSYSRAPESSVRYSTLRNGSLVFTPSPLDPALPAEISGVRECV
jgi:hypothetical protein